MNCAACHTGQFTVGGQIVRVEGAPTLADFLVTGAALPATPAAPLSAAADAVITTPSSIAVDAVTEGKQVAGAGDDLDVSSYAPLTILRSFEDWLGFATSQEPGVRSAQARARFLGRIDISGPSEDRMVQAIDAVLANQLQPVIR